MSEAEWSEEPEEAPKKKGGVPKWVWIGCGGGCLLALIGTIVVAILSVGWVKSATDPEKQWPRLQEVLHFEERPTELEMEMGTPIPFVMDQFVLSNRGASYTATIMAFKGAAASEVGEMFKADPSNAPFGVGAPVDPEPGELDIQGRPCTVLRYRTLGGQGFADELGPGIRVDISRGGRAIVVELRRMGSDEPLSDEEVAAFFGHFDLWKDG